MIKYDLLKLYIVLNFKAQRQKRHDVTNDVNVDALIRAVVNCMKNKLYRNGILLGYPWHVCNGICNTVDTDLFLPWVCVILKWPTMLKTSDSC